MKSAVPDLSIVIPTWNNKPVLRDCLQSVFDSEPKVAVQIIVVDNGSADQTCEFLAERYPEVSVVRNEKNLGFARACNQGIRISDARYILLLNNDTKVQGGTLERLVSFMDAHPAAGMASPKLLNTDGSLQMSACMDYTNLKYALLGGFQLPFPLNRFIRPMAMPAEDYDRVQEVAWVAGTCMIVRKEILSEVGLLDENIFMYIEDMEWCYRLRKEGWKIFFVPDTGVVHLKHHSSQHQLEEVFKQDYVSKRYFIRKHRSRKAAAFFTLFTLTGSMIKLPVQIAILPFQNTQRASGISYKIKSHWHIIKFILFPHGRHEHQLFQKNERE